MIKKNRWIRYFFDRFFNASHLMKTRCNVWNWLVNLSLHPRRTSLVFSIILSTFGVDAQDSIFNPCHFHFWKFHTFQLFSHKQKFLIIYEVADDESQSASIHSLLSRPWKSIRSLAALLHFHYPTCRRILSTHKPEQIDLATAHDLHSVLKWRNTSCTCRMSYLAVTYL